MKPYKFFKSVATVIVLSMALLTPTSCGSLDQWATGLQAVGNSLSGATYYNTTSTPRSSYVGTSTQAKEWHDCSSCTGGRCKSCGGSGKNPYAKNGRCGVCLGTGKCPGCDGKGGWYI